MTKNKCLHVITRLANGGAEESVMDQILQLAKKNIYCDIAIGKELISNTLIKFPLPNTCHIHRIPHLIRNIHPLYDIRALQELTTLITNNQYTIVHTHASKAGIIGRYAAYKSQTPIIIGNIHGISFPKSSGILSYIYKILEKKTARISDALICVGEDIKSIYLQAGIGTPSLYSVIYTGMDLSPFHSIYKLSHTQKQTIRKNLGIPLGAIVLSYIGRLDKSKNQCALIHMMTKIVRRFPKTLLCLVGDGPHEASLKKLVKKLKLENHIHFFGYIQNVWKLMPVFDIHCFTSLREGLPRVLVQTSAAGIPTVSYEIEGAHEIIKHNQSGYIIEKNNRNAFIHHLCALIKDTSLRKTFAKSATQCADSRWSLNQLGEKTQDIYKQLLAQKKLPSFF